MNLKTKTKIVISVVENVNGHLPDGKIISCGEIHQQKINDFLDTLHVIDLVKISTTPCLSVMKFIITTTITYRIDK